MPPCDSRDRADDRQAQARAATTVATPADEALEHPLLELGRDPRTVVGDDQDRVAADLLGACLDLGPRGRVADRVLEQVQHQAVKLVPDAVDHRRAGADRQLVPVGHRAQLGGRFDEHLGEIGRSARLGAPGVGAGEQQQVSDQPAHPARRPKRGLGGLGLLAAELFGQQLEVGEHARQWRAQLV